MTILHRRFLYIFFIIIFLILTPAVSFYAAGYNFNFQNGEVQRTGILFLETQPKGAVISLGDKKKFNWLYNFFNEAKELTTPIKLRNLLPENYEIILQKPGYFSYKRKIEIREGETLVLNDIILLKKSYPDVLVNEDIIKMEPSHSQEKIAALTTDAIFIITSSHGEVQKMSLSTDIDMNNARILWAPSDKKIILTAGNYPVFNVESSAIETYLANFIATDIEAVKWDSFSDNKIYLQKNSQIYGIEFPKNEIKLAVDVPVKNDFIISEGNIIFLEKNAAGNLITIYNLNNKNIVKQIPIPAISNYALTSYQSNDIFLHDLDHELLYIIEPWTILPIKHTLSNVKGFEVIDENKMIYWNDFEIWLQIDGSRNLIIRISDKIDTAAWHSSGQYIFYNSNNSLNVVELEDNKYLNFNMILPWQNTHQLVIGKNSQYIYFISPFDEKQGLYKLEVK